MTSTQEKTASNPRGSNRALMHYWPAEFVINKLKDLDYTTRVNLAEIVLKYQSQEADVYMGYLDGTRIAVKRARYAEDSDFRLITKVNFCMTCY